MASSARVVGAALVLAMGGFALVGCGGAGGAGGDGGAAAVGQEETVPERLKRLRQENFDRNIHWLETSRASSSDREEDSWINPGETTISTYSYGFDDELDENGNIIKSTSTNASDSELYTSTGTDVREYERDEKGWPVKVVETESNVTTQRGVIEEEVVNDEGETETVRRVDEENSEVHESNPDSSTIKYTYEYDDKGRVIKATSSAAYEGTTAFTYHPDGWIESRTVTYSYHTYMEDSTETVTDIDEATLNEQGMVLVSKDTETSTDGSEEVVTREYDDRGAAIKAVTHVKNTDGSEGEYSFTYENEKDENGNTVTSTCTVVGDGSTEYRRHEDRGVREWREVFDADGTIHVAELIYDEDYNQVPDEEKTYDGPYSVTENTYNDLGDLVKSVITYYDDTVETTEYEVREDGQWSKRTHTDGDGKTWVTTYEYDENGNQTSWVTEEDGKQVEKAEMSYTYIENPSDYQQHRRYLWW